MRPLTRRPLLLLLALALPAPLAAQTAERVRVQPRTVWAARGQATLERNAVRLDRVSGATRVSLVGTMQQVLVPVSFADEPVAYGAAALQERFYGAGSDARYSLTRFYSEVSLGEFTVHGEATPTVVLPRSSAAYTGERSPTRYNGVADSLDVFVREVLEAADQHVDWRRFVAAGERTVPAVVIVTAGPGGNCAGDATHVWPHRWHTSGLFGAPFETSRTNDAGETILIEDYIVQGSEECDGALTEIGVVAHETGHLLGLPDLYNTRDGGATTSVGHWDLMATGNYNKPASPAALGAWSRAHLGWAHVETVTPEDSVRLTLGPVADEGRLLQLPLGADNEYVLLENRRRRGTDQHAHGEGLLFWYVNPDEVANRLDDNTVGNDLDRPAIAVLAVDGRRDMETNANDGDAGDVWASREVLDAIGHGTERPLRGWQAEATWSLSDLRWSGTGEAVVADVLLRTAAAPPVSDSVVIEPARLGPFMEGSALDITLRTEPALPGAMWSADSVQLAALGLDLTPEGRLHGTLGAASGEYDLTIEAVHADVRARGEYRLRVVDARVLDAHQVMDAILGANTLDAETRALLDAIGNANGRLDSGDLVMAVRAGLLDMHALTQRP